MGPILVCGPTRTAMEPLSATSRRSPAKENLQASPSACAASSVRFDRLVSPGIGTVANILVVGTAMQVTLWVLPPITGFLAQLAVLVSGILLVAVASGLYIGAHFGPGPRDGLMTGLRSRFGMPIWAARASVELTVLVIGWLLGGTVGLGTVLFAATIGTTQWDIKRVIAYSTCSQLGYMFFAAGVSAYPAAMFHLTTHAFFKALLFLGAGSVIHALSDEQDLRNMGGIWKKIPFTYAMMWIGSLALAGFPFFAGFYSKDMILEAAFAAHTPVGNLAFWLGCAAAFLTAFYSWRLLIMAFHGKPRASAEVMSHVHESPLVMTIPLFVLSVGAIFSGWLGYELFVGHDMARFWGDSILILPEHTAMENAHHVPKWVKLLPIVLAASGVLVAVLCYAVWTGIPARAARTLSPVHAFFFNKWYFDELYDIIFVRPAVRIGAFLWQRGDRDTIDGFGPDGLSGLVVRVSAAASRLQSGFVFHYAFAMLIGVVVLVTWYYLRFGGM